MQQDGFSRFKCNNTRHKFFTFDCSDVLLTEGESVASRKSLCHRLSKYFNADFWLGEFFASDFVENSTSFYFFIVVKKIVVFFTIRFIACSKHLYNLLEFFYFISK